LKLFDYESECLLPCTTFSIQKKFKAESSIYPNVLDIVFSQTVQVTTTDFVTPPVSSFLSEVGGSMGLWLGLGVLQAAGIVYSSLLPWARRCRGGSGTPDHQGVQEGGGIKDNL
jgi:hypothetical protein